MAHAHVSRNSANVFRHQLLAGVISYNFVLGCTLCSKEGLCNACTKRYGFSYVLCGSLMSRIQVSCGW